MPATVQNFDGVGNVNGVLPPDSNGDVGPNHYVQWVNVSFAVFDKTGTILYGPAAGNTLWAGFGGLCETTNKGDPIALYDHLADRWLMSQFAFAGSQPIPSNDYRQCVAVSTTPDPTGTWHRYDFPISTTKFNDYPKFGVWPDGYYMSMNQFDGTTGNWSGGGAVVFERDKMLLGQNADKVSFDLFAANLNFGGMLPSDLDGRAPPAGTPNYFAEVDDDGFGWPTDRFQIWEFHVNWNNVGASTLGIDGQPNQVLNTTPIDMDMCGLARNCIPQPSTSVKLDALSGQVMYRLQYRNWGTHESLVTNHTVDVDGTDHAGIRWYELRKSSAAWTIHQQSSYAPDAEHRWMGSIAMDGGGDIALGYSLSSSTTSPSIRYSGRLEDDPLNSLPQAEAVLMAGAGSQTHSSSRWGDYTMMAVDPVDDCTFWYTNEYYSATSVAGWKTRIGSFKFPSCASVDVSVTKSDSPDPVPFGEEFTYSLSVSNGGTGQATGVVLTDTLPGTVTFISASSSQGSCGESSGVVTCNLGTLASEADADVTIVVRADTEGTIVNNASATLNELDADTSNNSDTEQTYVASVSVMPEGATHSGFTTFVVLANPIGGATATANLVFLTPSGAVTPPLLQGITIDPGKRRTIDVNTSLAAAGITPTDVATKVLQTSGATPIVAGVAMHKAGSLATMEMGAAEASPNWIIPEGATHSGFTTFVTIANPDVNATHVDVDYLTASGGLIDGSDNLLVPAGSRVTLNLGSPVASGGCGCVDDVSTRLTVVGSEPAVVAGMSLHKQGPNDLAIGGSVGVTSTADTWVVAEGATHSGFTTFVLVANPGVTDATVDITYLTGNQGPRPGGSLTIPALSRRTIDVNARMTALGLSPDDVSTLIDSTQGTVAVESTVQKQNSSGFVIADSVGSGGVDVAAASGTEWLVADGAAHSGFTTFILIANPSQSQSATVDVVFLTPTGQVNGPQDLIIPAGTRETVTLNNSVSGDASTLVTAESGNVVVEMSIDRVTFQGFSKGRSLGSRLAG